MVNLQNWVNQADSHWKEFQPTRYAELKASGELKSALQKAAEQTYSDLSSLTDSGLRHDEAWEMVREWYLFPPEKGSPMWQTSNMIDDPSPFAPLETLEQHLADVTALPKTDYTRDL